MKSAEVLQSYRDLRGRRQVLIVCPLCGDSHWLCSDAPVATCPRKRGRQFRIGATR
jgi:hypothetical protein